MRAWLLAAASLAVLIALLFARPHPTPGPPMRDFEAYYAAGTLWNHGAGPYSQSIWSVERTLSGVNAQRYEALPFVGPPALVPLFGAIAHLPFAPANRLWRALLVVSLAALAILTLRFAQRPITATAVLAIAVASLGFGPLTSALALGQVALPAFLFAALAVVWPVAGVLAWMQPNVALALLSQIFERRVAAVACGATLFALACALASGVSGSAQYVELLHRHSLAERFSAIQLTPAAIAYGFGATPLLASAVGTLVAVAAVCCWLVLMRGTEDRISRFCATCALLPLALPFFHEHDLLVVFVPAIVYALRSDARTWPLAAAGALLAATDWLGLAQRPDGTLQTLLLVGALGAALVALRERPRPQMLLAPAGVLALIAGAALLAHAHPAPVWPDAMGALPPHVGALDIAAAWGAEQRATGLFVQDAVWAGLRSLSLLGCAMVAAAIAVSSRSPADSRNPLRAPA